MKVNPGAPYGNRTRVSAVKGRRPGPLDEGRSLERGRRIVGFAAVGKQRTSRNSRAAVACGHGRQPIARHPRPRPDLSRADQSGRRGAAARINRLFAPPGCSLRERRSGLPFNAVSRCHERKPSTLPTTSRCSASTSTAPGAGAGHLFAGVRSIVCLASARRPSLRRAAAG
jgi:hypothetical protein